MTTENTNVNLTSATEITHDEDGNVLQVLTRANKLTVKALDNGHLQADFFRTHKHILSVLDSETGYVPDTKLTKSAIREGFRSYVAEHAAEVGVNYDPADRRTEDNLRKATYANETDVALDAIAMVTPDIATFVGKMPHSDLVKGWAVTVETMRPKDKTSKGTDLAMLGIEDGKYLSNGNLAWFDIDGTVTITTTSGAEIYQPISLELVSGQLKKFRMTQTQWNTDTTKSLIEAGLVTEEAKAEKSAKVETPVDTKVAETAKAKTTKSKGKGKGSKASKAE